MRSRTRGFTLIELLIVVVIIWIIASVAIPKFANTKEKAYVASMKADLRNLSTAQESYFTLNNNTYANSTGSLGTTYKASAGVTVTINSSGVTGWAASASHSQTTKTCAITLGPSTNEGIPLCQ